MAILTDEDIKSFPKGEQTIVIHDNKVYDVTKFANIHPGGAKTLKCRHGKDITEVFKNGPHKHSKNAYKWLEQYYIGDYTKDANQSVASTNEDDNCHRQTKDLVNWDEPVLWQVGHLGEEYHDWVDEPVDRPLRLFKSDFCEFFSITRWYVIPIVWFPIVALFLAKSHAEFSSDVNFAGLQILVAMCSLFISGVFIWTLLEYSLHRWLFHSSPPVTSYFLITLHFLLHGQHHKVPFDSGRLVFPPLPAAFMLSILYFPLLTLIPAAWVDSLVAGVVFGYVCYDLTHYYLHYGRPARGSYFDRLRAYHVRHHFESPNLGFGISSQFWDFPFDTVIQSNSKAFD